MLLGHDANMGRAAKERQRKMRLPYSNWPTTGPPILLTVCAEAALDG
jgi:hypothetical protein